MTTSTRSLVAVDGLEVAQVGAALSSRFSVVDGAPRSERRVRLDTFDGRLAAAGLTLERWGTRTQTRLVLTRRDGSATVTLSGASGGFALPAPADALPAGPVRDVVEPLVGIRALVAVSDEKREQRVLVLRNDDGKTVVRVEVDMPDSPEAATGRITVHGLRGYDDDARRAQRILLRTGLARLSAAPGRVRREPVAAVGDGAEPAVSLLARVLTGFHSTMRANLPGVLDDVDTEFLHDFRVALRRTRAALKAGESALPQEVGDRWEPELRWLGGVTAPVRDLDVYVLGLPTMAGWLVAAQAGDLEPFARHLQRRRVAARADLVRALRSARFRRLDTQWAQELAALAAPGHPRAGESGPSAGQLAQRAIASAYQRVLRRGVAINESSAPEDLHRLRARCKELRYALEVFAPVHDQSLRTTGVAELVALQDVLGRFQDSQVQRDALHLFAGEMIAEGSPVEALLAMGELIGHLDSEQTRARVEFNDAFTQFRRRFSSRQLHNLGGAR